MHPKPHNNPFPTPQAIPTPEILLPVIAGLFLVIAGSTRNLAFFVMLNNVIPGPDPVLIQHPVSVIPDNVIPDLIRDLFST